MTYHRLIAILIAFTFVVAVDAQTRKKKAAPTPSPAEESSDIPNVKWQKGPALGDLGSVAEVKVPTGYVFADGNDTRVIMEATHNPSTGRELGFVAPAGEDWFAVFEFDAVGYVRDDEKNSLDADALLQSIKTATEEGNQERIKRGLDVLAARIEILLERHSSSSSGRRNDAGAGFNSPRSLTISMRRSASSSREWQKRDSCTPRS